MSGPHGKKPTRRTQSEPANKRWRLYFEGKLSIQDMDDEELARMTFRNSVGDFRGRPPATLPATFARDVSRELLLRGESEIRQGFIDAIKTLVEVARSSDKDADRVRAANIILERVAGKVPDKLVVSEGRPDWESLVDAMLAETEDESIERARDILGRK
jgi:hypothetical protein